MKKIICGLLTSLIFTVTVSAQTQAPENGTFRQSGTASWYGNEFEGRPTASGELFDPNKLTAAHPTLPFGTIITVTNLQNNKQVQVRVNDRGPYVNTRILDVSRAAAEQLGLLDTGTAQVSIEMAPRSQQGEQITLTNEGAGYTASQTTPYSSAPVQSTQPYGASSPAGTAQPYGAASPAGTAQAYASPDKIVPRQSSGSSIPHPDVPVIPGTVTNPKSPSVDPTLSPTAPVAPAAPISPVQIQAPPNPQTLQSNMYQPLPPQTTADAGHSTYAPAGTPPGVPRLTPPRTGTAAANAASGSETSSEFPTVTISTPSSDIELSETVTETPSASGGAPDIVTSLEINEKPASAAPAAPAAKVKGGPVVPGKTYRLQIGSFKVPRNAVGTFDKLANAGLNPSWEPFEGYYRIVITGIKAEDVPKTAEKLGALGFKEVVAKVDL